MKVRFGIAALAAASLAACGGGGRPADRAASPQAALDSLAPAGAARSEPAATRRTARPAQRKTAPAAPLPPADQGIALTVRPGVRVEQVRRSLRRLLAPEPVERQQRAGRARLPSRLDPLRKPAKAPPQRSGPDSESVLDRIAQGKFPLPAR